MARKICDFNHISPELNREQIDELIGYYKTTHQKWFLYKKAHRHYKLIKYAARLTSGTIAGSGIASVILSGSVLTIISLGASLLIEILLDYKNVNENMNNCKYAYQSYQHLMIQIKTALRLGQYNIQNLVNSIANLDNFFVDICPLVDKYKKDYYKKYSDWLRISCIINDLSNASLMTYGVNYASLMTCYVLLMTFYALLMTYLMHYLTYDLNDLRRKP